MTEHRWWYWVRIYLMKTSLGISTGHCFTGSQRVAYIGFYRWIYILIFFNLSRFKYFALPSTIDEIITLSSYALQWRHNELAGVSNHQPHDFYSTVYSRADRRKHQSSASLASVWGVHQWPVNSPHKGPVTRKMFPFDDVIMWPSSVGLCYNVTIH